MALAATARITLNQARPNPQHQLAYVQRQMSARNTILALRTDPTKQARSVLSQLSARNTIVRSATITMAQHSANPVIEGIMPRSVWGLDTNAQGPPVGIEFSNGALAIANIIAASGNSTSVLIPSLYFPHIVFGVTSSQNGAVNIQRYIDKAGTVVQGAVVTVALTGGTAAVIDSADGKGFASFTIQITNTGAAAANITLMSLLLLAR